MEFWEQVIRSYSLEMVLSPGWELSSGARHEAIIALESHMLILNVNGQELGPDDLTELDYRAREKLFEEGHSEAQLTEYVVPVDFRAHATGLAGGLTAARRLADLAQTPRRSARVDERLPE
jgi:hypothetical protein